MCGLACIAQCGIHRCSYAVIGIEAFGKRGPEAERLFGSLGAAMLSLAQASASNVQHARMHACKNADCAP